MPLNVSADLLSLFKTLIGRPGTDSVSSDAYYTLLSLAQSEVFSEVVNICPQAFYQKVGTTSLPQMTNVDGNVFTFGVDDNSNPLVPVGRTQIYRHPSDVPDGALVPGYDYLDEATQIRLPRNRKFGGTLFWRGAVEPGPISAVTGQVPIFVPIGANELTAYRAARIWMESGNVRNPNAADRLDKRYLERRPYWALVWKQSFGYGGALAYSLLDFVTVPGPRI